MGTVAPRESGMMKEPAIILFDGVCNLCNSAVNFLIDRDPKGKFLLASLQSESAKELLRKSHLSTSEYSSMVLLKNGKVFLKSNAVLEIVRELGGGWPLLYGFKVIPRFLRDAIYNLVARNRYRIFGRRDQCRIPTEELKSHFLSEPDNQPMAHKV